MFENKERRLSKWADKFYVCESMIKIVNDEICELSETQSNYSGEAIMTQMLGTALESFPGNDYCGLDRDVYNDIIFDMFGLSLKRIVCKLVADALTKRASRSIVPIKQIEYTQTARFIENCATLKAYTYKNIVNSTPFELSGLQKNVIMHLVLKHLAECEKKSPHNPHLLYSA